MTDSEKRPRRPTEGLFFGFVILSIVVVAAVVAARRWLPPLASEHGAGIDRMIHFLLVTVGALFVVGHAALGYFVWRFSREDRVTFRLPGSRTEKAWSALPVVVMAIIAEGGVLVLGLPVWGKIYASAAPPDAVAVEITGEQFVWTFRYPGPDGRYGRTDPKLIRDSNPLGMDAQDPAATDDIVETGELRVPVNRPVRVRLRSKDTLHSLFLPHFRIKQDAIPGMTVEIWFVPTREGEYEIACAELCGLGHYHMRGVLRVLPQDQFDEWLRSQ